MSVKIYSREGQVFVETNGKIIGRITEIELRLTADRKDPKILFLTYDDKSIQQVFTEADVDWIELNACGGYSIIGSGIQPTIMYDGKVLGRIQEARFKASSENTVGTLDLKIAVHFHAGLEESRNGN